MFFSRRATLDLRKLTPDGLAYSTVGPHSLSGLWAYGGLAFAPALAAIGPQSADVSITKTADPAQTTVGSNVEYTIVVTNNGPGEATDVVVTDELPPGTTLVSSSAGCTGTTTVTCTVGTLASGASATIELVVTMPSTPGPVSNTATVESSSTDPTLGNNSSTAVVGAQLPVDSVPTLSPGALAFLALTIASIVLVVLRRVS